MTDPKGRQMIDPKAAALIRRACGCVCLVTPTQPYTATEWDSYLQDEAKVPCDKHAEKES
jgi:hypothetical protein